METIVKVAGLVFAVLFAVVWLVLSWQVAFLDAADPHPLELDTNIVIVAGFLATTVSTQTAAWLGIEILDVKRKALRDSTEARSVGSTVKTLLTTLSVPAFACWTFLTVALIVFLLSVFKQDNAPEVYQTFMLSALGWLGGAFAAAKPPAA